MLEKLPVSGAEIIYKKSLTRKEVREYKSFLYKGAKSTANGSIEQSSIVNNLEDQKDEMILLYVDMIGGKKITMVEVDKMDLKDYGAVLADCQKLFVENVQKKS